MYASVSYYPRVSEWIYVGDTAINLAQVATIEFGGKDEAYALLRLSTPDYQYEVRDAALVRYLREYVESMLAPIPGK
jgi:hypothetical protein